jgi:hypothetical protein
MKSYIRKLRTKPVYVRKQIFTGALIISMSFVLIIWISNIGYQPKEKISIEKDTRVKPFALLGQTFSETYNGLSASVGELSTTVKQEVKKTKKEKVIDLIPVEYQSR